MNVLIKGDKGVAISSNLKVASLDLDNGMLKSKYHHGHRFGLVWVASCVAAGAATGPLDCKSIEGEGAGTCTQTITASTNIWTDRSYAWGEAPSDLLGGDWAYRSSPMSTGPICDTEGGFKGNVKEKSLVAMCCASHCGSINVPTVHGVAEFEWYTHDGAFAISNHGGEPCTFYEALVEPGDYHICCSSCWASGVFFSSGDRSPVGNLMVETQIDHGPTIASIIANMSHIERYVACDLALSPAAHCTKLVCNKQVSGLSA
jgi:hypothetical protein